MVVRVPMRVLFGVAGVRGIVMMMGAVVIAVGGTMLVSVVPAAHRQHLTEEAARPPSHQ